MCGEECLIGATSLEAWDILERAPPNVEIVVARKSESLMQLQTLDTETPETSIKENTLPRARSQESLARQKRRYSFSLHYTSLAETPPTLEKSNARLSIAASFEDLQDEPTPPPVVKTMPELKEEEFTVTLEREEGQKLGMVIQGGVDNENLPHPHVKMVDKGGVVDLNGQIRRGDRLVSVDGQSLDGLTRKQVLSILKNVGLTVTLRVARQTGHGAATVPPSLMSSKLQSKQGSAEGSPHRSRSGSPSPLLPRHGGLRGKRTQSIASRLGLVQSQGIKVVELLKGPTGLGMHLRGSLTKDSPMQITIKEVLPGGVAYKSEKINVGDVLLEANGVQFEGLTQTEAVKTVKSLPPGMVRLVLLDKHYNTEQQGNNQ
jgi:C-terminal processing protease CtpA/Prc